MARTKKERSRKLNIGAGLDIRKGWNNLDLHGRYGADVIFDLNDIFRGKKLPFRDQTFDNVYCSHVLEDFIDPVPIMNEMARITKRGGTIEIRVPFHAKLLVGNINHKHFFSIGVLAGYTYGGDNYATTYDVRLVKGRYYNSNVNKWAIGSIHGAVCCFICNLLGPRFVESTFIQYLLGNMDIKMDYERR